ncbi:hypothetical protein WICMUC_002879 [Wickerhamomyces mucosus]|uniref:SH3 domain-containing protein n=1 Tax=Wickerhamomyces mucosus TaxID=1378264 RepID=A0A9P8PMY3_9ASCO|nr:hypothetical protein WICMUC_002879 [Wickerhamomyces mucosus]
MEQINLSTHGKEIQKAYEQVVRGDGVSSGSWVIYGPDSTKAYKVSETGIEFEDFLSSFDESQIQFGLARVNPPGSDVFKNLLVGWCPDSAPLKSRSSFAQNFAEISRLLKGYHVQITARDSDDLDKSELLSRLSAAAGARYSIQSAKVNVSSKASHSPSKPFQPNLATSVPRPVINKPITPKPTPSHAISPKPISPTPGSIPVSKQDEDEWNEPEIQERDLIKDPLKPNASSWKPIGKVNLQEVIKEEKSRPDPRAEIEALKQREKLKKEQEIENYLKSNSASLRSKPSLPSSGVTNNKDKVVGGISKNFGADNGKTPAQLWAEKRQQQQPTSSGSSPQPITTELEEEEEQHNQENDEEEEPNVSDLRGKFDNSSLEQTKLSSSPGFKSAFPAKTTFKPEINESDPEVENEDHEDIELPVEPEQEQEKEQEQEAPVLPTKNEVPPPPPTRNEVPPPPPTRQTAIPSQQSNSPDHQYEEEEEDTAASDSAEEQVEELHVAIAEYDHEASEDNELTFTEGDRITNIQFIDENWWIGELESGERGLFPSNHVSLVE